MSRSDYALKMLRLGGRIFQEHRHPPMPKEISYFNINHSFPRIHWNRDFRNIHAVVYNHSRLPHDLHPNFVNYYPPHPQIKLLMHTLRNYGLYRDEHRDFVEEMKRIAALRGKVGRQPGGGTGKRSQLKKLDEKK